MPARLAAGAVGLAVAGYAVILQVAVGLALAQAVLGPIDAEVRDATPAEVARSPTPPGAPPDAASGPASPSPSPTPAVTSPPAPADPPTPSRPPSPSPDRPPPPPPTPDRSDNHPRGDDAPVLRTGRVVGVVDGDTLDLADGVRVRLAIVDTPEVHSGVERCGPEAAAFTRDLVLGETITLYRPSTAPVTDPFGRLLGEVVVADGRSLNVALVAAGLGEVDERFSREDPDLARRARAAAATADRPSCAATAAPGPGSRPAAGRGHTGRTDGGWACHAAYRECLPAASGDLDCAEVGHEVALVGPDDPWRLDGNSTARDDGVGCESYGAWSASASYPYYGD